MNAVTALDVGGTSIRAGRWRADLFEETIQAPTRADHGSEAFIEQIVELASAVRTEPTQPVVLATAGTLDPATGFVHRAANLPLIDVPLRDILRERLAVPVAIVGDAWAATVGEFAAGAGRGARDGIFVTISTGIGLGLVLGGAVVGGHGWQAGELGHVRVDLREDAPLCSCGLRGCLELFASGSGMVRRWRARRDDTIPAGTDTAEALLDLAAAGDPTAGHVVGTGVRLLTACLAGLVMVFSPERIVIGGGLTHSSYYTDLLLTSLDSALAGRAEAGLVPELSTCAPSSGLVGAALVGAGDPHARDLVGASDFARQLGEIVHG